MIAIVMLLALSAYGQALLNSLSVHWLLLDDILAGLLDNERARRSGPSHPRRAER